MRRPTRFALAIPLLLSAPFAARAEPTPAPAPTPGPVAATVVTTLNTGSKQIRQFAFDGDPATFFASEEFPTAADDFTLVFDRPVAVKSVAVVTGRADGGDKLDAGTLEVSSDGKAFTELAKFAAGDARGEPKGKAKEVVAVRIKPTTDHTHPLAVREFTIESDPPLAAFKYPVEIAVDVSDSPQMKGWAEEVARLCERWYPKINEALKSDGYAPASYITMTITKNYNGVAMAGGNRITGSTKFFKAHPDDAGAMIHETTHIVQRYRGRGNPGWLVEGLADYFRFFVFEPGKIGPINPDRARYNASYRTTAAFLAYVTDTYDKKLVSKLNTLMREGNYKEEVFKEFTGKTVQELGDEWQATLKR